MQIGIGSLRTGVSLRHPDVYLFTATHKLRSCHRESAQSQFIFRTFAQFPSVGTLPCGPASVRISHLGGEYEPLSGLFLIFHLL